MAELLAIKRELTVIKVQIDGLLDCVDKMDRQRKDCSECPSREPSVSDSPHRGSVSSLERESPEPGEASEDEHYQHYYPHREMTLFVDLKKCVLHLVEMRLHGSDDDDDDDKGRRKAMLRLCYCLIKSFFLCFQIKQHQSDLEDDL
ncbi:hypothetical protein PAMP_020259 [Pampus punctatissimus]